MQKTQSRIHSRSAALLKLDQALKDAENACSDDEEVLNWFGGGLGTRSPSAVEALKIEEKLRGDAVAAVSRAFNSWIQEQTNKKKDWRTSVRNEQGAVELLGNQIHYWKRTYPNESERAALDFVIAERNKSIPVLFAGCEVIALKGLAQKKENMMARHYGVSSARDAAKLVRPPTAAPSSSSAPPGSAPPTSSSPTSSPTSSPFMTAAHTMIREAFGTDFASLVLNPAEDWIRETIKYVLDFVKEELAAIPPGVGLAVSGAMIAYNTRTLVQKSLAAHELLDLSGRIEQGDSRAALGSLRKWQLRAIALTTSKIARGTVNLGVHAASVASLGMAAGVQIGVSLANVIVAMTEIITEIGMQYKEKRALTAYLNGGTLDYNIFAQSALAAGYYLLNTPDSHIALQLVEIGRPTWRQDVELFKKDGVLKTVMTESANMIAAARYRIVRRDGVTYRERFEPGLWDQAKLRKNKGKFTTFENTGLPSIASDAPVSATGPEA